MLDHKTRDERELDTDSALIRAVGVWGL